MNGLVGQKRTFLSGRSLVADEAYIRRSIVDHNSDDEFVPGYLGTSLKLEALKAPTAAQRKNARDEGLRHWRSAMARWKTSDPALAEARSPEGGWIPQREYTPLKPDEIDDIVIYILALSSRRFPQGKVEFTLALPSEKEGQRTRVEREIGWRLEALAQCYGLELTNEPTLRGEVAVLFVAKQRRTETEGKVVRDTLHSRVVARCASDVVGDVVDSYPPFDPPLRGETATFRFVPPS